MKCEDVKIGQIWKRKSNGEPYRVRGERINRGTRELMLEPLGKGRITWKWDGGVINDFTPDSLA